MTRSRGGFEDTDGELMITMIKFRKGIEVSVMKIIYIYILIFFREGGTKATLHMGTRCERTTVLYYEDKGGKKFLI